MTPEVLFTMALGHGEGWSVKSCSFEGAPLELLLKLDFKPGHRFACPECGTCGPTHDTDLTPKLGHIKTEVRMVLVG